MATPAYTLEQYNALTAAIAEGAKSVAYQDRTIVYRSLAEMNQLMLQMQKALGLTSGKPARKVMAHSKGLGGTPTASEPWELN